MNFIQRLSGNRKPTLNKPVVSSRFIVRYTVDGNLNNVLKYECIAESEDMARYDFWDTHNEIYHDILSVEAGNTELNTGAVMPTTQNQEIIKHLIEVGNYIDIDMTYARETSILLRIKDLIASKIQSLSRNEV